MKSSVALLLIIGAIACKLVISNASDDGDDGDTLSPDENGSKLIWSELFDILKHFIEPSGYEYLRELLGGVVNYETAINQSIQSLRDLAPHLKNEENSARVNFLADECENLLNKLKSKGTSLKDISEFAKKSVAKLKDEL